MKKITNTIKVVLNYIFKTNFRTKPILLEIEPTNYCNLQCVMCPHSEMNRRRGEMPLSLFNKIVDQTIDTAWEYSLNMMGEPTMCNQLLAMIGYIKNRGGKVALYTNLNYKNDNFTEYFVRKKVDRVIVNIPAVDENIYREITGRGNYSLLIYNLKKIKEFKRKFRTRKPRLIASLLKMNKNIGEDKKMEKEYKKYFNYCIIKKPHDWIGDKKHLGLKPNNCIYKSKKKCSYLWTTATVLWDGKVVICCRDYEGQVVFGNIYLEDLICIWNSFKVNQTRKRNKDLFFCKKCKDDTMKFQFSLRNIFNYIYTNI